MTRARLMLRFGERDHTVDVLEESAAPDGRHDARVRVDDATLTVLVDGRMVRIEGGPGGPAWAVGTGDSRWVYHDGNVYEIEVQREGARRRTRPHGSLAAPMPATVRQIRVGAGDSVARGDTLIVLEAMKMELPVRANIDGTVAAVHCREGELVQPGRPLIDLVARAED
jgi:3-methylcrotonyl-CoA carboxylase alpha subunit